MTALRIALIRQRYTPYGGAERFVAGALDALRRQGSDITLISRRWPEDSDLPVQICDPFYFGNVWRDWSFARAACRAVAAGQFDLVQSHERLTCCDVYRAGDGLHRVWLAQRARRAGSLTRLGMALNPYHRYTLAAEARLFASPRLKLAICNSRLVRDQIRSHFGLGDDRLAVIYSGVDGERFHPRLAAQRDAVRERHGIPADAPLYLFVGSGFERKGLDTLLAALARMPTARLLVVGRDKRLARYRALCQRLGIADRVVFAGGVDDVAPYYGAADCFVLPTLYDPFPNAALEAWACGLPVITSDQSGAAELVDPGVNGRVCDALDSEALAAAMLEFGHRPAPEAARATVNGLTPENMARQLLELYRRLADAAPIPT